MLSPKTVTLEAVLVLFHVSISIMLPVMVAVLVSIVPEATLLSTCTCIVKEPVDQAESPLRFQLMSCPVIINPVLKEPVI